MPDMSSARTFIQAIQTRTTHTTRTLEQKFFASPTGPHPLTSLPNFDDLFDLLTTDGGLSSGVNDALPSKFKAVLNSWGLAAGEIHHLDRWPALQRELVRLALVESISSNRTIRFFWDLHNGPDEDTVVIIPGAGDLTVTFHSPKWKVRVEGPDSIIVDV
jgi:hypothetical protein